MFLGPSSPQQPSARDIAREANRLQGKQRNPDQPTAFVALWRWFSGSPLKYGQRGRITDAGWFTRGNEVFLSQHNPTGLAHRWDYMPRAARAAIRSGATVAVPAGAYVWWTNPALLYAVVAVVVVVAGVWAGWAVYRSAQERRHRRELVEPLALVLARVTQQSQGTLLARMEVPRNYLSDPEAVIRIPMPDDWMPEQRKQIVSLCTVRLGGEWNSTTTQKAPYFVELRHKPSPPDYVSYADVRDLLMQGSSATPLLGLGTEAEAVRLDFDQESPHVGMSVGTGGGKSSFFRLTISQMAFHGDVEKFTVVDPKMVSLQGMDQVIPNLTVHDEIEDEWDAIYKFRAEMDRRYAKLKSGQVKNEKDFSRWVLVLEEQNSFALESKLHWQDIKDKGDPATPPVWNDIAFILLKARQVRMNVIAAYQRMDDKATGGMGLRDQFGMKLLSRFSPSQWDMLVATRPRAIASPVNGRWTAVLNGVHRQVQVPYMTLENVADLVGSRRLPASPTAVPSVADAPSHEVPAGEGDTGDRDTARGRTRLRMLPPPSSVPADAVSGLVDSGSENGAGRASRKAEESTIRGPQRYTLKAACEAGVIPVAYETAKKRRSRMKDRGEFPEGVQSGKSTLYTPEELQEVFGKPEKTA